jgi:hypothetical protein
MADLDAESIRLAQSSPLVGYRWLDRGRAPRGYINGMAVAFSRLYRRLLNQDQTVRAIGHTVDGDDSRDVLAWYADILADRGMAGGSSRDRLIQLMTILTGLGMRESSGRHCEGRDMSAENVTSHTAEAGLFQVSFNSVRAHPLLLQLVDDYRGRDDLLDVFDDGVSCTRPEWRNWGQGAGRDFQEQTKRCPAFAVEYAALLLRHRRNHWGPINRKKAEVRSEAHRLFCDIADLVDHAAGSSG